MEAKQFYIVHIIYRRYTVSCILSVLNQCCMISYKMLGPGKMCWGQRWIWSSSHKNLTCQNTEQECLQCFDSGSCASGKVLLRPEKYGFSNRQKFRWRTFGDNSTLHVWTVYFSWLSRITKATSLQLTEMSKQLPHAPDASEAWSLKPSFHYSSWRVTGFYYPSTRPVETAHPSTRPVLMGNGNRSPVNSGHQLG